MSITYPARDLTARLASLEAEQASRVERGVPVPKWIPEAIVLLQGQLANAYNYHEHTENMPEAQGTLDDAGWWHLYLIGAAACLALAACVKWWPL